VTIFVFLTTLTLSSSWRACSSVSTRGLEDLADREPVEQHPNRREMQFDGRLGSGRLQPLYVCCNVDRLDVGELTDLVLLDPGEEVAGGPVIGHARVLVADRRGEKLEEARRGHGHQQ